jgi:hypothetical protein
MDRTQAILSAVADEIADVRCSLDGLADLTSELIGRCPAVERDQAMARAQDFDLLGQRLDGLSGLIAAIGAGVPVDLALHTLTLSDLSERLGGVVAPRDLAPAGSGELQLF